MKYSDVLVRHIYNVDFDPVRECEFNGIHLAVVLKKNNDNKTMLVAPLTRSSNGDGDNKTNLGKIATLPVNLRNSDSYLVYNQVRVVNCSRVLSLKDENRNRMNCDIGSVLFSEILAYCSDEVNSIMPLEERAHYHYKSYVKAIMAQVINAGYTIKRMLEAKESATKVSYQSMQLVGLLNNLPFKEHMGHTEKQNGIDLIIEKCLNNTITNELETKPSVAG